MSIIRYTQKNLSTTYDLQSDKDKTTAGLQIRLN